MEVPHTLCQTQRHSHTIGASIIVLSTSHMSHSPMRETPAPDTAPSGEPASSQAATLLVRQHISLVKTFGFQRCRGGPHIFSHVVRHML